MRMAYVNFAESGAATGESQPGRVESEAGDSAATDAGRSDPAGLGRDEWSVVEFARNDGLWSLNPNGLLQRIVRVLFAIRPPRPLANERLEALRRFAVLAWNKRKLEGRQLCEFVAAGFTRTDAEAVLSHVQRRLQIQSWPRGVA